MKIQFKDKHVCVFESALFRTTSTVLFTPDLVLVVDPNWLPQEVEEIRQLVNRQKGMRPVYLLFTHSDYDHIIGAGAFPEATTIAAEAFIANPEREATLEQIHKFDDEYYIERPYPIQYPKIDIPIRADGQVLEIGQTRLRFFLAPGHNSDGIFTLVEPLQVWLAGDYLCDVEFPFLYHSYRDYRQTLEKAAHIIDSWKPALLIPGHGEVSNQVQEMKQRYLEASEYLDRLEETVRSGRPFPEEALWSRYHFPRLMQKYHEDNLELLRREFSGKA